MKKILLLLICLLLIDAKGHCSVDALKAVFEKAMVFYAKKDYDKAINLFEKTLEIYPEFAPSYNFLGLCHKEKGSDTEQVIWYLKKSIEINPDYAEGYDNLGKVYYSRGDFKKAEAFELKALEKSPNLVSARLSLGWVYLLGMSRPGDAITQFEDVENFEKSPYALLGLGMAYFMDGNSPKALGIITSLRTLERDDLAGQLEQMIRQGRYLPPKGGLGTSLILVDQPINELSESDYTPNSSKLKNLKVRLSAPLE